VPQASGYALAAWLRCAELRARETPVETYDKGKLKKALKDIRTLSTEGPAEFMPELKVLLARHGVVLVLLPQFPNISEHGATFWIKPKKAVLLMSLRGCSVEVFWHRLFHQIGHILLHGKRVFVDERKVSPESARQEREADDFARDWLAGAGL